LIVIVSIQTAARCDPVLAATRVLGRYDGQVTRGVCVWRHLLLLAIHGSSELAPLTPSNVFEKRFLVV
jgi:hypothetical protein